MRLSGPHAALVQTQLELLAGKKCAGARAPERRRHIKSPDVGLSDLPCTAPVTLTCRLQLLGAYWLSNDTLGKLVQLERDARQEKADWKAGRPRVVSQEELQRQRDEEEELDEFDDFDDTRL